MTRSDVAGVVLVGAAVAWLGLSAVQTAGLSPRPRPEVQAVTDTRFIARPDAPDPNHILEMVNSIRSEAGLNPLEPNEMLSAAAENRARDMSMGAYYAHRSPEGRYYYDELPDVGYSCENLNLSFSMREERHLEDWLKSPDHRRCLLDGRLRHAGYAVLRVDNAGQPSYLLVAIHSEKL
jgi:uncharacterized protein YkwD